MITIDMTKAKVIGNDNRRIMREQYYAPYDRIIELNIPGQEEKRAEAEAKRAIIRERDAVCQAAIDAATTPDQIKQALADFVDA